ncbi:MAG: glycosyltransferase family 2 protein [Halobacteriota archaeon]
MVARSDCRMGGVKMRPQVCAVTVAYNNPEELVRLLSSLANQDDALNGLIIIDNSDERCAAENKRIFNLHASRYSIAHYRKAERNVGSAGGFRRGMEIAHENKFDWVWLLDQDGTASYNCLTAMLLRASEGDILCPNIVNIELPHESVPKVYANNFFGGWYPATWCLARCHICTFGTHGCLISRKALDTIGYYDDAFFFVGWEDYDYGYRATDAGLTVTFVEEAEALHPCSRSRGTPRIIQWIPVRLESVGQPQNHTMPCQKTRALAPFSQAHLESKHLTSWQFGAALVYSSLLAFYHKVTRAKELSLTATIRLFLKCFTHNVKNTWPYRSIEHLCREILS